MEQNLWQLPLLPLKEERTETLWETDALRVERIISTGQASPEGFWYDQEEDEWVSLLEGEALLLVEDREVLLRRGDTLLLPAHTRHRILRTGTEPPCIWLCVFGKIPFKRKEENP